MSVFKAKYVKNNSAGVHTYVRLYSATRATATYAALGNLTVRTSEFEDLRAAMPGVTFEEEPLERFREA